MRPWQQEKHYIQAMVLNAVSELPLVFKGGTYLWFFHGLRRFSEDFDFTASAKLTDGINDMVSRSLELFGIENESRMVSESERVFSFRISAKGPLNTGTKDLCFVYVEISKREQIIEKEIPLKFDYASYQLPVRRLLGMSLEEVGAEKVRAILTRRKARDIYDLYYLIDSKAIRFNRKLVDMKLGYYNKTFSRHAFLDEIKGRKDHYSSELKPIVFGELPAFGNIERRFSKWTSD